MVGKRQLKLAAHASALGATLSSRTDPVRRTYDIPALVSAARLLEEAKFDAVFEADALLFDVDAVNTLHGGARFHADATTVVAALASVTERIGLVSTATTAFNVPAALARQLQTLDHLSGGRVGGNAVTSFGGERRFGFTDMPDQDTRYRRAYEFVEIVQGLWRGWAWDAVYVDGTGTPRIDPAKVNKIIFSGEFLRSAGAIGVPRSPQGWPVQFQAGGSDAGLRFAAGYAEAIFSASPDLEHGVSFSAKLAAAVAAEKGPGAPKPLILPGFNVILGVTESEAKERERALVDSLDFELGRQSLSLAFGAIVAKERGAGAEVDLSDLDLDDPIPPERILRLPATATLGRRRSRPQLYRDLALKGLTVRELIVVHLQGHAHYRFVGSYDQVVDEFERWSGKGAADGFVLSFLETADAVYSFVENVVPRLQDRGLFRREYEGTTFREHLGLAAA
ncbi:NtaA/DmoA family FMN-dependent monooxygenase [Protofrankia coriariae]|uniref:NtaA/DmoA family FMN-dependent monooxygenase n=1 Tax=Protofrankia coriariae TaxID=1562887 RepID=UPI000A87A3DA|nr:NtaA/DmoA family FMN-dependent monooxygenase [Protofrankia coriariae]